MYNIKSKIYINYDGLKDRKQQKQHNFNFKISLMASKIPSQAIEMIYQQFNLKA